MDDVPFMFAVNLTRRGNTRMSNCINAVISDIDHISYSMSILRERIATSDKTKYKTYFELNPSLETHCVYNVSNCNALFIAEYARIYFSRMRLSSHRLKIETGRWSRLHREQRLCDCGQIQDESHVFCDCPLTQCGELVTYPNRLQKWIFSL